MSETVGVLDAGVVLARLDPRRRSHDEIVRLIDRSGDGRVRLFISVVNVAEVLYHSRDHARATGLDPVSFLEAYRISVHIPDLDVARRVARLASRDDTSLADRFAVATAEALHARLYTTDGPLAAILKRRRIVHTLF